MSYLSALFFFVTAPSPSEIYTLSLHDALPISLGCRAAAAFVLGQARQDQRALDTLGGAPHRFGERQDRKSTRLNSSHLGISYAVFCLKKKKKKKNHSTTDSRETLDHGKPRTAT